MPARKYYCDYCGKQFQDTPADRKRHVRGIQHQRAKALWYDSFNLPNPNPIPVPNPPHGFCSRFINTGFCRYGDSCKYLHPKSLPNANQTAGVLDNNIQQQQQPAILSLGLGNHLVGGGATSSPTPGSLVRDSMGVSWGNLPPSLQPPPEGGYPLLPFVDWG